MTEDAPASIRLPAISVILLAQLLTELDEFLRSGSIIASDLEDFLAQRGHTSPRFTACNVIDEVSFTAAHLRKLTDGIDRAAAEYVHLADHFGHESQHNG